MQCNRIQESISLDEKLSLPAQEHLGSCPECHRYEATVQAMSIEFNALRTTAPRGLRESIRSAVGRRNPRISLAYAFVATSIVALVAVPIYPYVAARIRQKLAPGQVIGNWPTYHMHQSRFDPTGQIFVTSDTWFDRDAARFTSRYGKDVNADYILRLEAGREMMYMLDTKGLRSRKPAPPQACVPLGDDLRWLISGDRRTFGKMRTTKVPDRVFKLDGRTFNVSGTRISSPDGEIVCFKDRATGRIIQFVHYGAAYSRSGRLVARKAAPEYIDTFDYDSVDRSEFDPSTLAKPVESSPAKHG